MQYTKKSLRSFVLYLPCAMLIIVMGMFLFPKSDLNHEAKAAEEPDYLISIETEPVIDLNLESTQEGAIEVVKNSVITTTNSPDGYKLLLSVDSEKDSDIHLDGDEENNKASKKIFATSGTFENPTSLFDDKKSSWGYGVPELENFNKAYNVSSKNGLKFAAVPVRGKEQLIHEYIGEIADNVVDIYYGTKINKSVFSGTYSKKIIYTAIANTQASVTGHAEVTPEYIYDLGDSRRIKIETKINTDKAINKIHAMVGDKTCGSVSVESTSPLIISCEISEELTIGKYDVSLNVPATGKEYFIPQGFEIKHLYSMQDMTPSLCASLTGQELFMDNRDGKRYKVKKEEDGKCWMEESLRFELDTNTKLTSNSSDLNTVSEWTPTSSTSTKSSDWREDTMSSYRQEEEKGYYYNFAAATMSSIVSKTDETMNLPNSICPKGWRLPVVSMSDHSIREISSSYTNDSRFHENEYLTSSLHDESIIFADAYMIRCVARGENKTLTYSAPGATNVPLSDTNDIEDRVLSLQVPSMSNKVFKGWSYTQGAKTPDISYNGISFAAKTIHITGNTTLYAVWTDLKTLSFYASGAANTPGNMTNENGIFAIPNVTPTIAGYRFLGWSRTNGSQNVEFRPGSVITINSNTTLYAVWQKLSLGDITYMHEMTSSVCGNTGTGGSKKLVDARDGKSYWVTKLPDGRCWMTQNLDLNLGGTLTSDTTDLNTVSAVSTRGTVGSVGSWATDGWSSYDPGNYWYDGYSGGLSSTCNSISGCPQNFKTTSQNDGHTHVGNYYGWYAATANGDANNSICPKGWKLPSAGEWAGLMGHYTESTFLRTPVFMTRTGSIWGTNNLAYAKFDVYYWTSSLYSGSEAYAVYAYHKVSGDDDHGEYTAYAHHSFHYGKTVRCVAR